MNDFIKEISDLILNCITVESLINIHDWYMVKKNINSDVGTYLFCMFLQRHFY